MIRGTFANIRIRNQLAPGTEGGWTRHLPDGQQMTIYDASEKYRAAGVPLLVLAGAEYGTGSSRDWAAKGTFLLGVRAVIAVSYERIHRSNLVGMGVLPLEFTDGPDLAIARTDRRRVVRHSRTRRPPAAAEHDPRESHQSTTVPSGTFRPLVRIDTPVEMDYYRNGGILQTVLRKLR